jgi:type IV fimbrial biogenesis protein FimT
MLPGMRHRGFTLPELLATLAIAAILLVLAAPAFARLRASHALSAAADQTRSALHLARRLALARGQSITVCPSADAIQCGFGSDAREWLLFANLAGGSEARRDAGEQILRRWRLPEGLQVGGTRGYAAFQSRPGAAATVTFEFSHPAAPSMRRRVIVSQTGRPRLER